MIMQIHQPHQFGRWLAPAACWKLLTLTSLIAVTESDQACKELEALSWIDLRDQIADSDVTSYLQTSVRTEVWLNSSKNRTSGGHLATVVAKANLSNETVVVGLHSITNENETVVGLHSITNQTLSLVDTRPSGEFELHGTHAKKSKLILLFIEVFLLGLCGLDRCYIGQFYIGMAKGATFGGLGVWAILDFIAVIVNCLGRYSHMGNFLGFQATFSRGSIEIAFILVMMLLAFSCVIASIIYRRGESLRFMRPFSNTS